MPLVESIVYTALPIEKFGSDSLKKDLLPRVVAGEALLTAGFSEIGAPALSRKVRTRATASGDGWKLSGEKVCVPYAAAAEKILVSAAGANGIGGSSET